MQRDHSLEVISQVQAPGGLALGERHVLQGVGVGDMVHKRKTVASERLAVKAQAADADACDLYRMTKA